MALRLLITGVLAGVVLLAALIEHRRRQPAPPPRSAYPVPRQLDRDDFPRPDAPWLIAFFWSLTCDSCGGLDTKVRALESPTVATCALEAIAHRALHQRYEIAAIPMILIVDAEGVVRRAFIGTVSANDLWAAVADVRLPGSVPESGLGALED